MLFISYTLLLILIILISELTLRKLYSHKLWHQAFDDEYALQKHDERGWAPIPHCQFDFHHRYLKGKNRVHFNNLGCHAHQDYKKQKDNETLRIALFGDTTAVSYELTAEKTIAATLETLLNKKYPNRKIEVLNVSCKNYNTAQLYQWWHQELADFRIDIVLYLFVTNHPRRNITLHESGKPEIFSRPLFTIDANGKKHISAKPHPVNINDMIYMLEDERIENIEGKPKSYARRLIDYSIILSFLEDFRLGKISTRNYKDRKEIKTLEKDNVKQKNDGDDSISPPYQWQLTEDILKQWSSGVKKTGANFLVVPFLNYYHAGEGRLLRPYNDHPFGLNFDDITERKHLPQIAHDCGFNQPVRLDRTIA